MVELRSDSRRVPLSPVRLKRGAQRVLEALGLGGRTLGVLLTDDRRIARLHERWMGEKGPTDVMSFSLGDAAAPRLLGDVVISVETAARCLPAGQARRPRAVAREVQRCLIHGILHLAGYDHRTPAQRQRMERQARRLARIAPSEVVG